MTVHLRTLVGVSVSVGVGDGLGEGVAVGFWLIAVLEFILLKLDRRSGKELAPAPYPIKNTMRIAAIQGIHDGFCDDGIGVLGSGGGGAIKGFDENCVVLSDGYSCTMYSSNLKRYMHS